MTTETELKPCPHCNHLAMWVDGVQSGVAIVCGGAPSCRASVGLYGGGCFATKAEAIAAWNRRSAASAEPAVAVKPLEWTKGAPPAHEHEPGVWWAAGLGGHYKIEHDGMLWMAHDAFVWQQHSNQKVAKAAAQADHEQRILSALAASLTTGDGGEAMVNRATVALINEFGGPAAETTVGKTQAIDPHKDTDCGAERREDQPTVAPDVGWRSMESAPKDGIMLHLLVRYDHDDMSSAPLADSAEPTWTIGFNNFDHDGEDVWKLAGWNWEHDCFTESSGEPIGWRLPILPPSPTGGDK